MECCGPRPSTAVARAGRDTPHYQIHAVDDGGSDYRIAVNVLSQQSPSELLYLVVDDFRHPVTAALAPWRRAGTRCRRSPAGRASTSSAATSSTAPTMRPLPPDVAGPDNDLADLLDHYVAAGHRRPGRARCTPSASAGARRPAARQGVRLPARQRRARHPHEPGQQRAFQRDDGVWQDGGLLLHFPAEPRWVASSSPSRARPGTPTTRPATPSPGSADRAGAGRARRPRAHRRRPGQPAWPAPRARDRAPCSTPRPTPVDLSGWRLADRMKRTCAAAAPGRSRPERR